MKTNKTYSPNPKDVSKEWHFIDASNQVLGRLATRIAKLLTGKNKPIYTPYEEVGDKVVITNARKIKVTGKKLKDKIYYRYTGYPSGLRAEKLGHLLSRKPTQVIVNAVKGMLPKNKLRKRWLSNLYVYEGTEHPHSAQENFKAGNSK